MSIAPRETGRLTPAEVKALLGPSRGRIRNVAPEAERTYAGIVYHSKAEALYAFELDKKKQRCEIYDWQRQVKFPLVFNGLRICDFVVDFGIEKLNGTYRYVELKGMETAVFKLKLKLFRALYPDVDYEVVNAWKVR